MIELLLILFLIFVVVPLCTVGFRVWRFQRRMRRFMADPLGETQRQSARNSRQSASRRRPSGNPFADFFAAFGGFAGNDGMSSGSRRRRKKIPSDVGEYVQFTEMPANSTSAKTQVNFTREEQIEDVEWEDIK